MTDFTPLQGFFKPHIFERMVLVYGKDQRRFWKEATSGKYTSSDDPVAERSLFEHADRRVDFFISDSPRYDGQLRDVLDASFNTLVVVEDRLIYTLETRFARYRLRALSAGRLPEVL